MFSCIFSIYLFLIVLNFCVLASHSVCVDGTIPTITVLSYHQKISILNLYYIAMTTAKARFIKTMLLLLHSRDGGRFGSYLAALWAYFCLCNQQSLLTVISFIYSTRDWTRASQAWSLTLELFLQLCAGITKKQGYNDYVVTVFSFIHMLLFSIQNLKLTIESRLFCCCCS